MTRFWQKIIIFMMLCGVLVPLPSDSATLSYQYDNLNRLIRVHYEGGTVITYSYDAAGNRLSMDIVVNGMPLMGDLDDDGFINLGDAIVALQVLSNVETTIRSNYSTSGADIGGNQKIGLEEVIYILQKVSGLR